MIKAKIFLGLFALPFLATGIWMLWSITTTLAEWQEMKGWERVNAHLVSGGYSSHSGDDSTTYEAYAEYTYTFNGQSYTGHRAAIGSGADNIGSFQEDLGRRLSAAQGRNIEIFVDPERPEQSVVNRDIRWAMIGFKSIFVVAFGGFGALMFFGIFRAPNEEKDLTKPEYAEKPWLANDDWQTQEIGSSSKATMYFAWGFTVLWNAISAPLPFIIWDEVWKKDNYPALLGLLFPLVGMGLLVWAIRRTLEWTRFGNVPLVLDPYPGSIGGHVGGTFEINYPYDTSAQFIVTLASVYSYESGSGKNRSQSEKVLWQDTAVAHTEVGLYGTRIVFRFDVPAGLKPSEAHHTGSDHHLWRLNLKAELPGIDIDRDYEIPVYATAQKSARLSQRAIDASETATLEMEDRNARAKIRTIPGASGEEMYYPMGRNIAPAITGMIVGACFLGPGAFMVWHEGMWIFGGIFFVIGALIFFCSLYMPINSLRVGRDSSGAIFTVRKILGIPVKHGSAMPGDIQSLVAESHFGTNSGAKHVKHYTIYANLGGKKKIVLGEGFHGTGEADAALVVIREKLGIRKKP